MLNGIVCVNKPAGFTSFDVVAKLRGVFKTKKIGHAGTLDPMAIGVLPVFVGKATKVIPYMDNKDKKYVAKFMLGKKTDTLDITGMVLEEKESNVTKEEVSEILKRYVGKIKQIPPMYSAVKKNGVPLYKLARQGQVVERKSREVEIYELICKNFDEKLQVGEIEVFCSSGTYIRTLCDDIGTELGVGGILTDLTRTMACGYDLKECRTIDEIISLKDNGMLEKAILPIESVFGNLPRIYLDARQEKMFRNGVKLSLKNFSEINGQVAVYGRSFLGVAHPFEGKLKIDKLLAEDID